MHCTFPTKFVYWEKISDHQKIKEKYLKYINDDIEKNGYLYHKQIKERWHCKCISSFFSQEGFFPEIKKEEFHNLIVWNPMDNMLKEMKKIFNIPVPKQSRILKMWFNYYEPGEWQEIHEHSNNNLPTASTYSGIYLMDLNEDNPTIFLDKHPIKCWAGTSVVHTFTTENIEEGSVIIFPSELLHYVNPCLNKRITISFYIDSTFV
jgi:hypothetical protein